LEEESFIFKGNSKLIFLDKNAQVENFIKSKKGNSSEFTRLTFHLKTNIVKLELERNKAEWLMKVFSKNSTENPIKITLQQLKTQFEEHFEDFELFWFSKPMQQLKENGVILSL
jgi:hypothetical protein